MGKSAQPNSVLKTSRERRAGVSRGRELRIVVAITVLAITQSLAHGQENGLVYPVDIVADDNGWVVADFKAHGLLAIDSDGNVTSIAQGPGLPRTPLYGTRAVLPAPDGDGWLVADPGTFALYRVGRDGALSTITTDLDIPPGLARFGDNSVLVSDLRSGIGAVMRVTMDGAVQVFAEIDSPKGMGPLGRSLYLSHNDAAHLVDRAISAPASVGFAVVYGVSNNTLRFHDIETAAELIDYHPQDDAGT